MNSVSLRLEMGLKMSQPVRPNLVIRPWLAVRTVGYIREVRHSVHDQRFLFKCIRDAHGCCFD